MANTNQLINLLKSKLETKARKAFVDRFPEDQRNELVNKAADEFARDLSEYAEEEIKLMQRVIVETIGINFDLSTFRGENTSINNQNARGFSNSTLYNDTLSESQNNENNNSRIVGRLDLVVKK